MTATVKPLKNGTTDAQRRGAAVVVKSKNGKGPVRETRQVILDSGDPGYVNRLLIGTPTRGTVRIEWHCAVRGLTVPPNWSMVSLVQAMDSFVPVRFQVADAQNLIVREAVQRDFEWLLLLEDDVIPQPDLLVRLNKYMNDAKTPIVSGLYFTKSEPSEPLIYRGRGNGSFHDFKPGDKVWCDGVPTGCLLVHCAILREMWADSQVYLAKGHETRAVFETPTRTWINPDGDVNSIVGTSDLDWCSRVIEGGYLKRAGWDSFARRKYPFLVDTGMYCRHATPEGMMFPP